MTARGGLRVPETWRTVGLVFGWQTAASTCYYAVIVGVPFFREAFGVSRFLVGLLVTLLTLGQVVFLLPLGALVDSHGAKTTLSAGLVGMALVTPVVAAVPTYPLALAGVFVLGALYAVASPGTSKAVFTAVPPARRNVAMGIKQVGVTAGSGASALVVPAFAATWLGWQGGFYAAAGLALAVAVIFALAFSAERAPQEYEWPDVPGLLSRRPYRLLVLVGFCLGAGLFAVVSYTILYLNEAVGVAVGLAGLTLALMQVAGSVGRVLSGHLVDVLPWSGAESALRVLLAQTVGAALAVPAILLVDSALLSMLVFVAVGFFVLGFTGVFFSCIGLLLPDDEVGGATAGGQLSLNVGALFAPPLFGMVVDNVGYGPGWTAIALLLVVAVLLAVRLERLVSGKP